MQTRHPLRALLVACAICAWAAPVCTPGHAAEKPLPYHVREAMREVDSLLRSIDSAFRWVEEFGSRSDTTADQVQQKFRSVDENLKAVRTAMEKVKEEADKAGVGNHATIAEAHKRIDEVPGRLEKARAAHGAQMAQDADTARKADADAKHLLDEYARVKAEILDFCEGTPQLDPNTALDAVKARAAAFDKFGADAPKLREMLDAFSQKYGTDGAAIRKKLDEAGYTGQSFEPANAYDALRKGPEKVGTARALFAEAIVKHVNDRLSPERMQGLSEFYAMAVPFADLKKMAEVAAKLAPENANVSAAARNVDQKVKSARQTWVDRINKRTWAGHTARAPANAAQLAASAMAFFRSDPEWGKRDKDPKAQGKRPSRPLAVSVTGAWSVQARNLLGQPTMYGLPILLAVQLDDEKADDLARVFALTLRTAERAGVKAAPPFESCTVGNSYYIRASRIPGR